jgi:hypothetical protein
VTIWESLRQWLRRQSGVERLEVELTLLRPQSGHALAMIEELSAQLAQVREEAATRQKVMRDELMESEARTMTLIEELQTREPAAETDTLSSEPNKSGHTRWTERKRARMAVESNPAALVKRITNGDVPGNSRGRNDRSGDGKAQVSTGS